MTWDHFEFDVLGGFVDDKVTDEQDWIGGLKFAFIMPRDLRLACHRLDGVARDHADGDTRAEGCEPVPDEGDRSAEF